MRPRFYRVLTHSSNVVQRSLGESAGRMSVSSFASAMNGDVTASPDILSQGGK
jgi:hypothetical protein